MGWTIALGATWWIIAWVVIKITHMILSMTFGSWDVSAGISVAIVQGAIDVLIVLGVIVFLVGTAIHIVSLLV